MAQVDTADIRTAELKEGVLEKLGTTRTPQPVLAVTPMTDSPPLSALTGPGPVLVLVGVGDPGNLGTLLRSAEASGCAGVVSCGASVDVHHPRVVRASAGSVFGIPVVEPDGPADDPVVVVDALRSAGRRALGATSDGRPAPEVDLAGPVALLLGNEAHGLDDAVRARVDGLVSVPMTGAAESLNVAMAGTVLVFEAQRQRANVPGGARPPSLDSGSP
jgi:TrmH family RNA methyltransferase